MFDLNWISAVNAGHSAPVLSKGRTDFGVEMSSRSTHFCRGANATVETLENAAANDTRPGAGCDEPASTNAALRRAIGLVRRWRERAHARRRLFELDDHILRDIGLTRGALFSESISTFRW
jgi:uncharacterized protein YjiS (DUF1127 family)